MQISVIIPVFNAEKYISKCIQSILSQNYTECEILLIDDGSNDKSGIICDDYAKRYDSISVFHQKNQGVGSARNLGIEKANGKYIMFIDSDDFLENNLMSSLDLYIENRNPDCIIYGYRSYPNDNAKDRHFLQEKSSSSKPEMAETLLKARENFLLFPIYNKLYKRELIKNNHIRFNKEIHYYEDLIFNMQFFLYTNSIQTIPQIFYNYVSHPGERLGGKITKPDTVIEVAQIVFELGKQIPSNQASTIYNIIEYYNMILHSIDCSMRMENANKKNTQYYINFLLEKISQYGYYNEFIKYIGNRKFIFICKHSDVIFIMLILREKLSNLINRK